MLAPNNFSKISSINQASFFESSPHDNQRFTVSLSPSGAPTQRSRAMPAPNTEAEREEVESRAAEAYRENLDAGVLFVLKSKGSWLHCGYHLTTAIVAPALLSLPLALSLLGWVAGVLFLTVAAAVTFYSYVLLSIVLEYHAKLGRRLLRFRDMAHHILGPGWGHYYIAAIQFLLCFSAVVASALLAGQGMKAIYVLEKPDGAMKLYEFISISGAIMVILAQIPSFHSLRHLNLVSLILCLAYSACATAASIYVGHSRNTPQRDYELPGEGQDRVFGVFNAISIISMTYGNGIIPEIQATVAPPVGRKVLKGLCLCYVVVVSTFFTVAISGYWAFGNRAQGNVLSNFIVDDRALIPKWFIIMTNVFTVLQIFVVSIVYLQPMNEVLEVFFADPKKAQYSTRNVTPRIAFRSLVVVVSTAIAAMLPFFGDIAAVVGAFCILPLDFVVPAVMYNITFRPPTRGFIFWTNLAIVAVFSALTVAGCIAAVRQVVLDAKTYKLFANL
ncbi:GABA transporter 1 [Apostasia shenzhenica]|uniref:GABA transporter 1 n=1 Tax=Apostasia shenzhenica TaxID=1088818 RepID=A0A2I0BH95_9ASPA|nr:GABA transporter 1 [Apostasia shenzhenica]